MKNYLFAAALLGIPVWIASCSGQKPGEEKKQSAVNAIPVDSSSMISREFGERLSVNGDFNGDKITDTVYESYISIHTGKESYKHLNASDIEDERNAIAKNRPVCRIYSTIPGSDTLDLMNGGDHRGIDRFENLGNINRIKGDELGYIIDMAGHSQWNIYYILTYSRGSGWSQIFEFPINEMFYYGEADLYEGDKIVWRDSLTNEIKYIFYSDSATAETGTIKF
jgi:hypothetical protein